MQPDTETHLAHNTLELPVPLDNQMIYNIQKIASRLAAKSSQLLGILSHGLVCENLYLIPTFTGNFTTNLAEGYMHIRSKFDGRNQVNRSQNGSWKGRCGGAGLQANEEGPKWGPACWDKATKPVANKCFRSVSAAKAKGCSRSQKKSQNDAKLKRKRRKKMIILSSLV